MRTVNSPENSLPKGLSGKPRGIIQLYNRVELQWIQPPTLPDVSRGPCITRLPFASKEKLGNEVARSLMYRARVIGKKEAISQLPLLFVFLRVLWSTSLPTAVSFSQNSHAIIDKFDRGIDLLENIVPLSLSRGKMASRKIQVRQMRFCNCDEENEWNSGKI